MIFNLLTNLKPYDLSVARQDCAYYIIDFILARQLYSDPFRKILVIHFYVIAAAQTQISFDISLYLLLLLLSLFQKAAD